jgi:acetyl-CoA carboxylase carboxyl transferase subunit alpha
MNLDFLDFEQPIAELEIKIEELRLLDTDEKINIADEILKLEEQRKSLTKTIFSKLKPIQIVQLARHPQRPYPLDYFNEMFTEFDELSGDRHYGCGHVIIGGVARLDGRPVVAIGQQKGRKTSEKVKRNFGMPKPEDYRKALRLMEMAEKFKMPILTFIDTPGAYPGIDAEEHNQSEAISRNLFAMSQLKTPIICTVIGEGGSGGALAIGVGDYINMLQYSIYSVISPEGCASILWKDTAKTGEAAEALGLTSERLKKLNLVDHVIEEPLGGAHRNPKETAARLKKTILEQLKTLDELSIDQMLKQRYQKWMSFGR